MPWARGQHHRRRGRSWAGRPGTQLYTWAHARQRTPWASAGLLPTAGPSLLPGLGRCGDPLPPLPLWAARAQAVQFVTFTVARERL